MRYFFFKKSERRAVVLRVVQSPVRTVGEDGVSSEIPELEQVAEVDARIANRLTVALNEVERLGDRSPVRMQWIVRDFRKHIAWKVGPWTPAKWHLYAIGEVPSL